MPKKKKTTALAVRTSAPLIPAQKPSTPIHSDIERVIGQVRMPAELREFIRFCATPSSMRELKTQKDFASRFGVSQDTLTDWKRLPGFWDAVAYEIRQREKGETADIIDALREKALGGDPAAVRLWLQYTQPPNGE